MEDEQSGSTDTPTTDSLGISEYVSYVVLVYHLISTVFVIGMASLVISTILKTRALHNVHNILIVNLMVSDIVGVVIYTLQTTGMMFSHIIGIQDPFRCDVLYFSLFPLMVTMYTFVMLSVDKFIAIKFALRYKAIVTHRRAYQAIAAGWIFGILFRLARLIYEITSGTLYHKSSQFGSCVVQQSSILMPLITTFLPLIIACGTTVTLDIYLSIKAYQVYKTIQKENREAVEASKNKLKKILQQLKPLITLLVAILGNMAVTMISLIVFMVLPLMVEDKSHQTYINGILLQNLGYLSLILHPMVYGLYFREVRQPLCRRFKQMALSCKFKNKTNSILPSVRTNTWM